MERGHLEWFDRSKGYGMILHEDGRTVHFSESALPELQNSSLTSGVIVFFDLFQTQLGWEANNIRMFLEAG